MRPFEPKAFIADIKKISINCEIALSTQNSNQYPQLLQQVQEYLSIADQNLRACVLAQRYFSPTFEELQQALLSYETQLKFLIPQNSPKNRF